MTVMLGFDFNLSSPEHFIDRYLHVLGFHMEPSINKNVALISTLHYIDETMLQYPLSKIAAVSVILAINIYKLKQYLKIVDSTQKFVGLAKQ